MITIENNLMTSFSSILHLHEKKCVYFYLYFFKERLGLKLTHKKITTKVVLPVSKSKGEGAIQGEVKMCKEGEVYFVQDQRQDV